MHSPVRDTVGRCWGKGCEVDVKIPSDPERGPLGHLDQGFGSGKRWGWKPLLRTPSPRGFGFFLVRLVSGGFGALVEAACFMGNAAALTAQLGRYVPGQVANARIRTGKAQLSGRTLEKAAFATLPVCGGLSHPFCRLGVRMGMCHQLRI